MRRGPTTNDAFRIIRRFNKGVGGLHLAIWEVKIFSAWVASCHEEDAWARGQGDSPPVRIIRFLYHPALILSQPRLLGMSKVHSRALNAEAYPVVVADPGQDA